jgi:hypothetical protein
MITAKYASYQNYKGNNFFILSNDKSLIDKLEENIVIENVSIGELVDVDKGVIDVTGTITHYINFKNYPSIGVYFWLSDINLDNLDLEGRKIEDLTELKYIWFIDRLFGKKSPRIIDGERIKFKKTEPFHLKSSNWTIKWI